MPHSNIPIHTTKYTVQNNSNIFHEVT